MDSGLLLLLIVFGVFGLICLWYGMICFTVKLTCKLVRAELREEESCLMIRRITKIVKEELENPSEEPKEEQEEGAD